MAPALCCRLGLTGLLDQTDRVDESQSIVYAAPSAYSRGTCPPVGYMKDGYSYSPDVDNLEDEILPPWSVYDEEWHTETIYREYVAAKGPRTVLSDDSPNAYAIPCMPVRGLQAAPHGPAEDPWACVFSNDNQVHRDKLAPRSVPFAAMVARPVGKKEIAGNSKAREALRLEWDRLRSEVVWDESSVREWKDVARKATNDGVEVHFGYLFALCVGKNSELPEGRPKRKFKGRVVFQGNRVVNQNWDAAMFQDLGSCPATMEASKAADCYGCVHDHDIEIADAIQAYIQAVLEGTETWVCLPPEERPASWSKFHKPVVRLKMALYGHPDSGTFWEKHCDKHVVSVGFEPVSEEWPSCYFHPLLKLFLIIYVDGFKLSGPKINLKQGWSLVASGLNVEPPYTSWCLLGLRPRGP